MLDWTKVRLRRMITPRAIRSPDRHRHLPLHGRRGLDEAPARPRRGGVRRGLAEHRASSATPAPRRAGSRWTRRATPSSSPSRRLRERSQRRRSFTDALASGPILVRIGLHTGTPLLTEEGYVGEDVIAPRASPRPATAGRCSSPPRRLSSSKRELRRSRRAPAQGSVCARAHLPARRRRRSPRSRSLYRTNLPVPATPFLGREQELAEVRRAPRRRRTRACLR